VQARAALARTLGSATQRHAEIRDMNALQILDNVKDEPGTLETNKAFVDFLSGTSFKAFYILESNKKRRVLLGITEDYFDDHLQSEEEKQSLILVIHKVLSDLRSKTKHQPDRFAREENPILVRLL